jgi:hypothetical protein
MLGYRCDCDRAGGRGVGAVKRIEQARCRFDEIAGGGEAVIARNGAEADQPFAVAGLGGV